METRARKGPTAGGDSRPRIGAGSRIHGGLSAGRSPPRRK